MSLLYIHVYAACQCPHGCTCTCQCCIAMSVLHVPVHATCPCPCCFTQYMLRVHVHVAGPCPCCMSMSMLFGLEHSASIWTCNIVILQSWVRIQQTPQPTLDCQSLDGLPSGMALPCRLSSEGRQRRIWTIGTSLPPKTFKEKRTCNIDIGMQHGHEHAACTGACSMDLDYKRAACPSSCPCCIFMYMLYAHVYAAFPC